MSGQGIGALLGLTAGVGLLLVLAWFASRRPAPVGRRIAPYLPTSPNAVPVVGAPWAGISAWATLAKIALPSRPQRRRPARSASGDGTAVWAVAGAVIGALCAVALQHGSPTGAGATLMAVFGGVVGALASGQYRARLALNRRQRINDQLPTVAELLAFAVAAGQTPLAALDRIAHMLSCELSEEIAVAVSSVRAGESVDRALRALSERIGSPAVARFVDGMLVAIERGTPLAELLRAQAADCRADERRRLLELAGRKDVAMLVPVVFLILPTVVLVALFPGITALRLVVA